MENMLNKSGNAGAEIMHHNNHDNNNNNNNNNNKGQGPRSTAIVVLAGPAQSPPAHTEAMVAGTMCSDYSTTCVTTSL
jgi:hypothetical protein